MSQRQRLAMGLSQGAEVGSPRGAMARSAARSRATGWAWTGQGPPLGRLGGPGSAARMRSSVSSSVSRRLGASSALAPPLP